MSRKLARKKIRKMIASSESGGVDESDILRCAALRYGMGWEEGCRQASRCRTDGDVMTKARGELGNSSSARLCS